MTTAATKNQTLAATKNQTFFLFLNLGLDVRPCNLSLEEASKIISAIKKGSGNKDEWVKFFMEKGAIQKRNSTKEKKDWSEIYRAARQAGLEAGHHHLPRPMVVQQHANPADDNSKVEKEYFVSEGVCGMCNVVIKGNTSFARWCRKQNLGYKNYYGGYAIVIRDYNQSLERKEAHARAMAQFLESHGISCYVDSRLD